MGQGSDVDVYQRMMVFLMYIGEYWSGINRV